jgi:hypothetical protein
VSEDVASSHITEASQPINSYHSDTPSIRTPVTAGGRRDARHQGLCLLERLNAYLVQIVHSKVFVQNVRSQTNCAFFYNKRASWA